MPRLNITQAASLPAISALAIYGLHLAFFVTFWLTQSTAALATARATAGLCDAVAEVAAKAHSVPLDVLRAITRTETGRLVDGTLQPWPWTVNMEGTGRWFATEDEARAYVFRHFKRGARSFDVGCFQINYKWHGKAFRSIDEMFDPDQNARYAAKFLAQLFVEFGDWTKAAGAYHSRTPKYAEKYEARFDRIRRSAPPIPPSGSQLAGRSTTFGPPRRIDLNAQLAAGAFIGSGTGQLGSAVPLLPQDTRQRRALLELE